MRAFVVLGFVATAYCGWRAIAGTNVAPGEQFRLDRSCRFILVDVTPPAMRLPPTENARLSAGARDYFPMTAKGAGELVKGASCTPSAAFQPVRALTELTPSRLEWTRRIERLGDPRVTTTTYSADGATLIASCDFTVTTTPVTLSDGRPANGALVSVEINVPAVEEFLRSNNARTEFLDEACQAIDPGQMTLGTVRYFESANAKREYQLARFTNALLIAWAGLIVAAVLWWLFRRRVIADLAEVQRANWHSGSDDDT